jgi:HD-GYP domain-containing protein (c-di-GMP phosphodiesterase class II)
MKRETVAQHFERLCAGDIFPGMTLPFDIYDENDALLIGRGFVVNESLCRKLAAREMFADAGELASARKSAGSFVGTPELLLGVKKISLSIFRLLDAAQETLASLLKVSPVPSHFDRLLIEIAANIQTACRFDSDAAIARVFLNKNGSYPLRHAVNTATFVELMLRKVEQDDARRRSAIAAALTMDIAMIELKEQLCHQSDPLTVAQREAILAHPAAAVAWLKNAGVQDAVWLEAVAQHHEQMDGTGYPQRVAGDAIVREARAVELAQRYGAMISGRSYRPQMPSSDAFRRLLEKKQSWDTMLGAILAREVGTYPPGSYVRLAKREIAVVIKRSGKLNEPIVRVLVGSDGIRLEGFPKRNTKEPGFRIFGTAAPEEIRFEYDYRALWDLTTIEDPVEQKAAA